MTDTTDLLALSGLDPEVARRITAQALDGSDDGELYLEYVQSEALTFDNGRLKGASFDTSQGFGLRAVTGEVTGFAHSGEISEAALKRAADAVSAVRGGRSGTWAAPPSGTNTRLYTDVNPIGAPSFDEKVRLLAEIDAYARAADPRVRQVTASLAASWAVVEILRPDGLHIRDVRPLVRLNVSV
ncbi:MAG: metalloprotease TldD, partial [Phyllobacteriaceae bacterium]|nr:metalloprotease TldD [Phyllobacteriaceae bacterium]